MRNRACHVCAIIAIALLAGCAATKPSASPVPAASPATVTVQGAYDYQGMPTQASCIDLTYAIGLFEIDGHQIAQQNSHVTWRDGLCLFPFSFGHVRAMSVYRLDVPGGTPEAWLTPQQVARPVLISVYDGFYIGPLGAALAAESSTAGTSGPCPAGQPGPSPTATSPAGRVLLGRALPLPAGAPPAAGPPQGVLSLAGYVTGLFPAAPSSRR